MSDLPPPPRGPVPVSHREPETAATYVVLTTKPAELRRHDISDEQLEMLIATNHDGVSEAFWGCLGAGLSALLVVAEPVWNWHSGQMLTTLQLIEFGVAVAGLIAAVTLRIGFWRRRREGRNIAAEIRVRPTITLNLR